MKVHLVTTKKGAKLYAGTGKDASATRVAMMEKYGLKKSEIFITPAEIPTAKTELLAFVNGLCAEINNA